MNIRFDLLTTLPSPAATHERPDKAGEDFAPFLQKSIDTQSKAEQSSPTESRTEKTKDKNTEAKPALEEQEGEKETNVTSQEVGTLEGNDPTPLTVLVEAPMVLTDTSISPDEDFALEHRDDAVIVMDTPDTTLATSEESFKPSALVIGSIPNEAALNEPVDLQEETPIIAAPIAAPQNQSAEPVLGEEQELLPAVEAKMQAPSTGQQNKADQKIQVTEHADDANITAQESESALDDIAPQAQKELSAPEKEPARLETEAKAVQQGSVNKEPAPLSNTKASNSDAQEVGLVAHHTPKETTNTNSSGSEQDTGFTQNPKELNIEAQEAEQQADIKFSPASPHKPSEAAKSAEIGIDSTKAGEAEKPAIFKQISDHISSITSKVSKTSGESTTTINLEPGHLGKVSVQITTTKDGEAQIKLLVKEPETYRLLQEGQKELLQELKQVTSGKEASFSFDLERRDNPFQGDNQHLDLWSEMSGTEDPAEKSLELAQKSAYNASNSATLIDIEGGRVNTSL